MAYLKNEELRLKDLSPEAIGGGGWLSGTFNGYEHAGGFQECAEISAHVNSAIENGNTENFTLSEFRATLFFYFRAIRHSNGSPDQAIVNNLVDLMRKRISQGRLE